MNYRKVNSVDNILRINSWVNGYIGDLQFVEDSIDDNLSDYLEDSKFFGEKDDLETLGNSNRKKDSLFYQLVYNCVVDYNKLKSGYWQKVYNNVIDKSRDFVFGCKLVIDRDESLNDWLSKKISLSFNGENNIISSVRFMYYLAYMISGNRIEYKDEKVYIPLFIFQLFERGRLDLVGLTFTNITLYILNTDVGTYDFDVRLGYYTPELRSDLLENKQNFIGLNIIAFNYFNTSITDPISLPNFDRNSFIIIWYCDDNSNLSEDRGFQPSILNAKLEFYIAGRQFTKEYDRLEVERIKDDKNLGYVLTTNFIKFNDLVSFFKDGKSEKVKRLMKEEIFWRDVENIELTVEWSNCSPGSYLMVELVELGLNTIEFGAFKQQGYSY